MEILFTLFYSLFIGFFNVSKKLAVRKSSDINILALFTTVSFLLCMMWIPFGVAIPFKYIAILAFKGFILSISWNISLKVLKSADVTIVSNIAVLSSVLSFLFGIVLFNESVSVFQVLGSFMIIVGVIGINLINKKSRGKINLKQFLLLLVTVLCSACCSVIDKYTTANITSFQVQFWFLLFVCLFSWMWFSIDCIKSKKFLIKSTDFKNCWIYIVGTLLFIADFFLFRAYAVPGSKMITITILSKLQVLVVVFAGMFIFKEKNIWKKLLISLIVIMGAVLISVF